MVRNLDTAARDAAVRDKLVALLQDRIDGSDDLDPDDRAELRGRIREKPGLWRYLRITKSGLLRIDRAKITAEAKLDGKTLLRTSEMGVDAAEIARGYKALLRGRAGLARPQAAGPAPGLPPQGRPHRRPRAAVAGCRCC